MLTSMFRRNELFNFILIKFKAININFSVNNVHLNRFCLLNWIFTYDNESFPGSSQSNIYLVIIVNEAQVFLAPTVSRIGLNSILGQRSDEAKNHVIPFAAWKNKKIKRMSCHPIIFCLVFLTLWHITHKKNYDI